VIKINGHSGFGVELIDENTIRKVSTGAGAIRLHKQISKQKIFHDSLQTYYIRSPEILAEKSSNNYYSADMEYIAGKDFVHFFIDSNRAEINQFMEIIADYISSNIKNSVLSDVSMKIIEKAHQLEMDGVDQRYTQLVISLSAQPIIVPVGPCHGDLTFSNMLFKGPLIYFIDFLDSFVESPIQDLVKLRQDTWFSWSLGMYKPEYDKTKIAIIFRYLDNMIQNMFFSYEWYREHYFLFQLLNMMRIIPYCKESNIRKIVTNNINIMLAQRQ